MKTILGLTFLAALSSPAWSGDVVITRQKHTDATNVMGQDQPALDSQEVLWIGKDHMRMEEGDRVTIVRADLKKMYMLDIQAKTCSTVDLPFDLTKFLPAEMAPMMEQMASQSKVTVTPTGESQKIKDWNTTKYTLSMTMPMGSSTQEMWVTNEIGTDRTGWQDMFAAQMASSPFGAGLAAEMRKIDGIVIKSERTQTMMGTEIKSWESVLSVEEKEAPAGHYDVPAGYTEKPFDPMGGMMMGGPGRPRRK